MSLRDLCVDEVQQYPRARQLIKYLVADGRYDYIETGSLISLKKNVQDIIIPSEEEHIEMFPSDIENFYGHWVTLQPFRLSNNALKLKLHLDRRSTEK